MRRAMALWLLMAPAALPAYAGHGTIRETETQIIVEYYGDAADKPGSSDPLRLTRLSAPEPTAANQPAREQNAGQATADPAATKEVARRQKSEVRALQREQELAARRQEAAARGTRKARQAVASASRE